MRSGGLFNPLMSNVNAQNTGNSEPILRDDDWVYKSTYLRDLSTRILISYQYHVVYLIVLLINIALIIWILTNPSVLKKDPKYEALFVLLEFLVNVSVVFEIVLKIICQQKRYFESLFNLLDVVIALASWGAFFVHFVPSENVEKGSLFVNSVLAVRYTVPFIRLIILVKNHRENIHRGSGVVVLDSIELDDQPFMTTENE
eukprot:TRINITY_DN66_c0_g1_i1.p1 TRINITY_DN66_c0_g1~~TRINITY_DN66_c0_g1_i1.p1  ORF type:complete len:201 (+),score=39.33 TRINITY_DN66_c0_g1_i1:81-683(+)